MDVNHCQSCSLCCKLLGVASLEKRPGIWCKFCTPGKGCRIHEQADFPTDCANYVCLWLQGRQEGNPLPDELRPDRCKVVIDARLNGQAHNVRCDPMHADAWRKPMVQRVLNALIRSGSTLYLVTKDGQERRLNAIERIGR